MPQYNRPEIDLSIRLAPAVEMLTPIPERAWGRATELARLYGVSRQFLDALRGRVLQAATDAWSPRQPGPQPPAPKLVIERAFLRRAIAVLAMLKGSLRDIQPGLLLL